MKLAHTCLFLIILLYSLFSIAYSEGLPRSESTEGSSVYFISPKDGDVLTNPVHVVFGLSGMGVSPAGVEKENTGHHHLLIDVESIQFDQPIGKDDSHRHFGGGQTETMIELEPGKHTLQLLLGDHFHIPHDPAVISEKITITVVEPEPTGY